MKELSTENWVRSWEHHRKGEGRTTDCSFHGAKSYTSTLNTTLLGRGLVIPVLKVPLPLHTEKKYLGKLLLLQLGIAFMFLLLRFFLGEEMGLWNGSKGETLSRILGFREQGCIPSGPLA